MWKKVESEKAKVLREKGREKYEKTVGRSKELLSIIDNDLPKHNTQKEIAADLGWSTGKLAQADVVNKYADEINVYTSIL